MDSCRGGLFCVNDELYCFCHEIERMVRKFVVKLVNQSTQQDKQEIIDEIVSDDDIQLHWSVVNMDLDHHVGEQLLHEIVQLWWILNSWGLC